MSTDRNTEINSIVLSGYGINCEREMALAAEAAGARTRIVHLSRLLEQPYELETCDLLLLPGGFSFGDELGGAKVFANKMLFLEKDEKSLKTRLQEFVAQGGAIFGVCNGFQLLIKLGLLPYSGKGRSDRLASLTQNQSNRFENRWCWHRVNQTACIFTQGLERLYLPIRHGEGRFATDVATEQSLFESKQVVLQYTDAEGKVSEHYPDNPNGSRQGIAGICDETGRVFGMMAHPEAYIHPQQHPCWTRLESPPERGDGWRIFHQGIKNLKEQKSIRKLNV